MNIYVLWTRTGKRYFARSSYSHLAVRKVETTFPGETVSAWDIATSLPLNATIL